MTSQIEQWMLIFYVIIPSGCYLFLITLDYIDNNRGSIKS